MAFVFSQDGTQTQQMTYHNESDSQDDDESQDGGSDAVWGRLFPVTPDYETIELCGETCTLGRNKHCTAQFDDPVISNCHCSISREMPKGCTDPDDATIFLQDTSSNGTFVNEKRVGKNNRQALQHGDRIALTLKKKSAPSFVFHDCAFEKANQDASNNSPVRQKYNFTKQLGSGACGAVFLAVNKTTGHKYAIKKISKKRFNTVGLEQAVPTAEMLLREVEILRKLDHPNIVHILEVFDSEEALFIVLELATGGELFDLIVKKKRISEDETRYYFAQMFLAVKYLHEQNISHRDLKPENVLLAKPGDFGLIKITDFGLAKLVGPQSFMKTMCGTPAYQAPEVLLAGSLDSQGEELGYSGAVDMWSLGVMLYICLCGFPPFAEEITWHKLSLNEQVLQGKYNFPKPHWDNISDHAKDLVTNLLLTDPQQRFTVHQALDHPFIQMGDELARAQEIIARHEKEKKDRLDMPPPSTKRARDSGASLEPQTDKKVKT